MRYADPSAREFWGRTDSETIQNAVDYAEKTGINVVSIPRFNARTGENIWMIDTSIILPSNIEIVLDNCHLRLCDGVYENVFRNFKDILHEGFTLAERKQNIVIRGVGNAVLDGGNYNGLSEKNANRDGRPSVFANNLILLYNIRDFVLENFELRDQRFWAVNLIHAQRGRLSNLRICGSCNCPNQDGIDLRVGCSNIIIENIVGQAGDDIVALSAIGNRNAPNAFIGRFSLDGRDEDIHDVIIRNVVGSSVECAVVALRNSDGRKIYNITIDTIHGNDNYAVQDGNLYPDYPKYKIRPFDICRIRKGNSPYTLLRFGQDGYYGNRNAVLGEMYNIHATNLHMHIGCVIMANVALSNSYIGNIYAENNVDYIFTTKSGRVSQTYGANMRNVVVENVFYDNQDNDHATAFDLDMNKEPCTAENFIVRNAFVGNCKNVFHAAYGSIRYTGVTGTFVDTPDGLCLPACE